MIKLIISCTLFGIVATAVQAANFMAAAVIVAVFLAIRSYTLLTTRTVMFRTEGQFSRQLVADHEGGHAALIKAGGGTVTEAVIYPDGSGGHTKGRLPKEATIIDHLAVDVAGEVATGTSRGCGSDHAYRDALLAQLPANERGRAKQGGYDRASNVLHGFFGDGGALSISRRLMKHGRL